MRAHLNAAVHHGLRQSFWFHLCWIDSVEWFRVRSGKILSVILDHVANQLFKLLKCVFASHICGLRTFHQEVQCHIRCKQSSYTWAKKCHITPPKKLYYCPANLSHLCAISWVKCLLIFEPFIDLFWKWSGTSIGLKISVNLFWKNYVRPSESLENDCSWAL